MSKRKLAEVTSVITNEPINVVKEACMFVGIIEAVANIISEYIVFNLFSQIEKREQWTIPLLDVSPPSLLQDQVIVKWLSLFQENDDAENTNPVVIVPEHIFSSSDPHVTLQLDATRLCVLRDDYGNREPGFIIDAKSSVAIWFDDDFSHGDYFTHSTENSVVFLYVKKGMWHVAEWNFGDTATSFEKKWILDNWPVFHCGDTMTPTGILCASHDFIICKTVSALNIVIFEKRTGVASKMQVCDEECCAGVNNAVACFHPCDPYIVLVIGKARSYRTPLSLHVLHLQTQTHYAHGCLLRKTTCEMRYLGWHPVVTYRVA